MRNACPVALAVLAACARAESSEARIEGVTMGTTYSVQVADLPRDLDPRTLHGDVHALLDSLEHAMSTYDPDSELSRFNASASTGWRPVSREILCVVEEALRIGRLTGGAFDVTVGPLVDLWGFGPGGASAPPPRESVAAALDRVGHDWLETCASPPSIRKRRAGVTVDLSALAKGFAVDQVALLLESRGIRDFLVEIGGELRAGGRHPNGRPWRVAVEHPLPGERPRPCVLDLVDAAVATSGDYRRARVEQEVRYPHVLDPRTGHPVETGIASATVVAPSAMEADAMATALMVLPHQAGLELAEREGLAARLLVRSGDGFVERTTAGFAARRPEEGRR